MNVKGQNVTATNGIVDILSYISLHTWLVLVTKLVLINEWMTGSSAFIKAGAEQGLIGARYSSEAAMESWQILGQTASSSQRKNFTIYGPIDFVGSHLRVEFYRYGI